MTKSLSDLCFQTPAGCKFRVDRAGFRIVAYQREAFNATAAVMSIGVEHEPAIAIGLDTIAFRAGFGIPETE
jgi:hypothetical protein